MGIDALVRRLERNVPDEILRARDAWNAASATKPRRPSPRRLDAAIARADAACVSTFASALAMRTAGELSGIDFLSAAATWCVAGWMVSCTVLVALAWIDVATRRRVKSPCPEGKEV